MTSETETVEVNGWSCSATWRYADPGQANVTLELSKNFGATWPRVMLDVEVSKSPSTSLRVAEPYESDERAKGASGYEYSNGIEASCVAAITRGLSAGLRGQHGVDISVVSGAVSVETSPKVCEFAAETATRVLLERLTLTPSSLSDILAELSESWAARF